jgi:hypothetical protein
VVNARGAGIRSDLGKNAGHSLGRGLIRVQEKVPPGPVQLEEAADLGPVLRGVELDPLQPLQDRVVLS